MFADVILQHKANYEWRRIINIAYENPAAVLHLDFM